MDWFLGELWPWWLGACALAALSVAIWLIEHRILGVSGMLAKAIQATDEADAAARSVMKDDPNAFSDEMLKATIEEFGEEAVREMGLLKPATHSATAPKLPLPRSVHILFLAMIAVGGVIGGLLSGGIDPSFSLGETYSGIFGDGWQVSPLLVVGGILVGFGTRMAGGCTSGHGLLGCSRLQSGSIVATASFFGAGVATSYLLSMVVA